MKLYELIYLLNKELQLSSHNDSFKFIKIAYNNVINKLKESFDIKYNFTKHDINKIELTDNMRNKIIKLILIKLSPDEKNRLKKIQLYEELINITGIGKSKADELIKRGLTNIKHLSQKKWESYLPSGVILMLNTTPLKKIPYSLIKSIEEKLTSFKADTKLVGGFIRKKPFSKDIDVMIVSDDELIMDKYISFLKKHFDSYVYAHGNDKVSLILKVKSDYIKLDVFRTSKEYQHAMLLYAIGSKKFNIKMRSIAKRKGYLLNQYGLYKLDSLNKPISVNSEKDFFTILNIPYVSYDNR